MSRKHIQLCVAQKLSIITYLIIIQKVLNINANFAMHFYCSLKKIIVNFASKEMLIIINQLIKTFYKLQKPPTVVSELTDLRTGPKVKHYLHNSIRYNSLCQFESISSFTDKMLHGGPKIYKCN